MEPRTGFEPASATQSKWCSFRRAAGAYTYGTTQNHARQTLCLHRRGEFQKFVDHQTRKPGDLVFGPSFLPSAVDATAFAIIPALPAIGRCSRLPNSNPDNGLGQIANVLQVYRASFRRVEITDGKTKTTHDGRLIRAALFDFLTGAHSSPNSPRAHIAVQVCTTSGPRNMTDQRRRSERARQHEEHELHPRSRPADNRLRQMHQTVPRAGRRTLQTGQQPEPRTGPGTRDPKTDLRVRQRQDAAAGREAHRPVPRMSGDRRPRPPPATTRWMRPSDKLNGRDSTAVSTCRRRGIHPIGTGARPLRQPSGRNITSPLPYHRQECNHSSLTRTGTGVRHANRIISADQRQRNPVIFR